MRKFIGTMIAGTCLLLGDAMGAPPDRDESWWAVVGPDGIQRINVRCGTNFLDPRHIVVKANVPVVLSVSAEPNVKAHNFKLQIPGAAAGNVDAPINAVQRHFEVLPTLSGRFAISCMDTGQPPGTPSARSRRGSLTILP